MSTSNLHVIDSIVTRAGHQYRLLKRRGELTYYVQYLDRRPGYLFWRPYNCGQHAYDTYTYLKATFRG